MSNETVPALTSLGWDDFFRSGFAPFEREGLLPARVVRRERERYLLADGEGERAAELTGALRRRVVGGGERPPAVGDWVAVRPRPGEATADVHAVVPRRSALSRREAGPIEREQVLAANVDVAFLVMALDRGRSFHPRRLERLAIVVRRAAVDAVVLLNKADLHEDTAPFEREARGAAPGLAVHALSAASGKGLDAVRSALGPGRTGVFLGPSGAGKSTLVNALLGEDRQATREVRPDDGRGRHATSARELIRLPGAGLVIDTPGLREIGLWAAEEDVLDGFPEVAALAALCRFRDCRHESEPGCAVLAALGEGGLDRARFESFLALRSEAAFSGDRARALEEKNEWERGIALERKRMKRRKRPED
ncbi:MAG: ribosome small subunit-dependent GTPase A [Planctomycetes bacterium]|jgi:ribosome biogenesis GTPase|nr:ribosome small subunit-dependent GTPase A [Planctomycetota bacterium]